jgi:cyclohexanecarboxylate-CoA ligase
VVVRDVPEHGEHTWSELAASSNVAPPAPRDAEAVVLLLYTSGTTADPKGVLHSHETLLAEARSLGGVHGLGATDTTLMPSPLAHISGIVHAFLVPCVYGARAVLMERWDPTLALELIAAEGVTYMVGAPTFLRDLARHPALDRHDVSSFRLFSCGGADVDPALVRDAAVRLGCVAKRVYGSSEFPTITTTGPDDPPSRRIDSDGRPIGAAELRLIDDDGVAVPAGTEGEVLARGPECFLGYRDPALTPTRSPPTGGSAPATSASSTRPASCASRAGRRTSSFERARTSARESRGPPRDRTRPVARSPSIGLPIRAAGEIACAVLRRHQEQAPSPTRK